MLKALLGFVPAIIFAIIMFLIHPLAGIGFVLFLGFITFVHITSNKRR